MTVAYRRRIECPNCRHQISDEDPISKWIKANPHIDSRVGFTVMDNDLIVHRFKTTHGREFQCLMFIEIKSFGKQLEDWQRDTMAIVNQFLRNRRTTPFRRRALQINGCEPNRVWSTKNKRYVNVKAFGFHLLSLSGSTPDDSRVMIWDKRPIDKPKLNQILRFDLDPDTLRPLDFRIHHYRTREQMDLTIGA